MNETLRRRIDALEKKTGAQLSIGAEFHRHMARLFTEPLTEEEFDEKSKNFEVYRAGVTVHN